MKLLKPTIIASIHDSHKPIRLKKFLRQVTVNFGGTITQHKGIVINKPEAVGLSVNKFNMKGVFEKNNIPSFEYGGTLTNIQEYPVVVKSLFHNKHTPHLKKVDSQKEMDGLFFANQNRYFSLRWERFYWEKFTEYDREFRIHVSKYKWSEVFATEKISRGGKGWVKNKDSCTFKKDFEKPHTWGLMLSSCKKVLRLTGLDIGGFDVAYNSDTGKYWLIEVNTACGMGDLTRKAYSKELNKIALIKQFSI